MASGKDPSIRLNRAIAARHQCTRRAAAAVSGLRGPLTLVFFLLVVAGVVLRRLS
ncbi:hypothetical protein [Nocardia terpenica]|uniref:hypothetical protein n=1 Tax=Nocardia terpenica TaxID=455432 RepID=UPI0012E73E71|nr:hypothetical protein [Nocardia terpenica]